MRIAFAVNSHFQRAQRRPRPRHLRGAKLDPPLDFANVHRCAVPSAESRAGQGKYTDVALAAAHLHGMLDV